MLKRDEESVCQEEECKSEMIVYCETHELTVKIMSFSKCFVSCFSCLPQGSAASLPYH